MADIIAPTDLGIIKKYGWNGYIRVIIKMMDFPLQAPVTTPSLLPKIMCSVGPFLLNFTPFIFVFLIFSADFFVLKQNACLLLLTYFGMFPEINMSICG